jgi:hypothetical protein
VLKNSDIAKALGVTPQRVIALKKRGMPDGPDIETILRWREERLKANAAQMAPKIEPADPMQIAAGTLEERIDRHKLRVDEAERVWQASMLNGDPNSSRFQSAYNQSLKTLVALENEAFDRKVKGGDFIRRADAEDAMLSLCNLVVSLAEKMPMELADQVNPDASAKAAKVLEAWVISFRKTAAEGACALGREEDAPSDG